MYHFRVYGDSRLLTLPGVAVYASRQAPEAVMSAATAFFHHLMKLPIAIGGGWQSPLEKRLLQSWEEHDAAGIIFFLAKSYAAFTLTGRLKQAIGAGQLAVVEPAVSSERIQRQGVEIRDRLMEDLLSRHLFLYIHPGGRLQARCKHLLNAGKQVFLFNHPANAEFFHSGAILVDRQTLPLHFAG
ncbi:MAG: hypothetical protein D6681_12325 [Calditrichaeota bacterium]|nr:MAG: hypothetical protein D6681_12325 [Calditrichota bacterium]